MAIGNLGDQLDQRILQNVDSALQKLHVRRRVCLFRLLLLLRKGAQLVILHTLGARTAAIALCLLHSTTIARLFHSLLLTILISSWSHVLVSLDLGLIALNQSGVADIFHGGTKGLKN